MFGSDGSDPDGRRGTTGRYIGWAALTQFKKLSYPEVYRKISWIKVK